MALGIIKRGNGKGLALAIRSEHERTARRGPEARGPEEPPAAGIGEGAEVEQVGDQLVEGDVDLGLAQLVGVLDALGAGADGAGLPVEGGPGAPREQARLARQVPVRGALAEAVRRRHGVPGQLDLDDAVDDVAARQGRQAPVAEHTLDLGEGRQRRHRVVQDRQHAEDR